MMADPGQLAFQYLKPAPKLRRKSRIGGVRPGSRTTYLQSGGSGMTKYARRRNVAEGRYQTVKETSNNADVGYGLAAAAQS